MLRLSALVALALTLSALPVFADQVVTDDQGNSITVLDPQPKTVATVSAKSTLENAEISLVGDTAAKLGDLLAAGGGVVKEVDLALNREGEVSLIPHTTLDTSDSEVTTRTGGAMLDSVNTTDLDSVVVDGHAAQELYRYLQYGRSLSIRIDEDGNSSIVGPAISCEYVFNASYACTIDVASIDKGL
jgi:hypothetical protein